MNITSNMMYWLTRLDSINCLTGILFVISLAVLIGLAITFMVIKDEMHITNVLNICDKDDPKINELNIKLASVKKLFLFVVPVFLTSVLALVFVPSTKEMCAIMVIPRIANSECVSELSETSTEIVRFAKTWLKDKLKSGENNNSK